MSIPTINKEQMGESEVCAYRQTSDEVIAALDTDAQHGLGEVEARARLERYGLIELTAVQPVPA